MPKIKNSNSAFVVISNFVKFFIFSLFLFLVRCLDQSNNFKPTIYILNYQSLTSKIEWFTRKVLLFFTIEKSFHFSLNLKRSLQKLHSPTSVGFKLQVRVSNGFAIFLNIHYSVKKIFFSFSHSYRL